MDHDDINEAHNNHKFASTASNTRTQPFASQ